MDIPLSELSRHPIHFRTINGFDQFYIEKGEGPTVILIHGFPDLAGTWDETIEALSQHYHCIAPFMRGYYPTSTVEDGDYDSVTIAGDIAKLAGELGVDQYHLIGHDWGASVAYSLANLEPQKVQKVVAVAIPHPRFIKLTPLGLWRARHFIRFRNEKSSVTYTRRNDFAYIDRLIRRWAPNWKDYKPTSELVRRTYKLPGRLEAALGYYWSFSASRKDRERGKIVYRRPQVPIMCFAGKCDGALSLKPFHKMKADMGDQVQLRIHETAGHWPHREAPEFFIPEVQKFLAKN